MNEFRKFVYTLKHYLDLVVNSIVIILMAGLIAVVFIQVTSRYVFNSPTVWSEELARYLSIWVVFLASAIVFRCDKHLSVDFVVSVFPPKLKLAASIFKYIVIVIFFIIMLSVAPEIISITFRQTSPTLRLPIAVMYLAFVVLIVLMSLEIIFRIILLNYSAPKERGDV